MFTLSRRTYTICIAGVAIIAGITGKTVFDALFTGEKDTLRSIQTYPVCAYREASPEVIRETARTFTLEFSPLKYYKQHNFVGPILGEREARLGYSDANDFLLKVETTAYWTHDPIEASGTGLAADGKPAIAYRTIAVDPRVIPFHSEVYVPEIGWCVAHDTGNAIKGNILDIAMPSRGEAFKWGRRTALVLVRPPSKQNI